MFRSASEEAFVSFQKVAADGVVESSMKLGPGRATSPKGDAATTSGIYPVLEDHYLPMNMEHIAF